MESETSKYLSHSGLTLGVKVSNEILLFACPKNCSRFILSVFAHALELHKSCNVCGDLVPATQEELNERGTNETIENFEEGIVTTRWIVPVGTQLRGTAI